MIASTKALSAERTQLLQGLVTRCRRAGDDGRALFSEIWDAMAEDLPAEREEPFRVMVDVGAWESAALQLLPPGWRVENWSEYSADDAPPLAGKWIGQVVPRGKRNLMDKRSFTHCQAGSAAAAMAGSCMNALLIRHEVGHLSS